MTKEDLAAKLNNREYLSEISDEEATLAEQNGLVVVFGYSDDNVEFRGAISDEVGCYGEKEIQFSKHGIIPDWSDDEKKTKEEATEYFSKLIGGNQWILASFGRKGWMFNCGFSHAKFNIQENGEHYGQGMVFNLAEVLAAK